MPRCVRRVGQLSGLPGTAWRGLLCGGRDPSLPLPLTTPSPSAQGLGTRGTGAAPRSASPVTTRSTSAARGWGEGTGAVRRRGGAGRGSPSRCHPVPGISRCCGARSRLALCLVPGQRGQHRRRWTALAAPRARPDRASSSSASASAAARRGRSQGRGQVAAVPTAFSVPRLRISCPPGEPCPRSRGVAHGSLYFSPRTLRQRPFLRSS